MGNYHIWQKGPVVVVLRVTAANMKSIRKEA